MKLSLTHRITCVIVALGFTAAGCSEPDGETDVASEPTQTSGVLVDVPDDDYPVFEGDFLEYFYALAECLERAGWSAAMVDPDEPSLRLPTVPAEQEEALVQAREDCELEIGVPRVEPPTESEIRAFYRALLETKACLETEGYDISEPPSEDAFVESYDTGPWSPYLDIPDVSETEWERLNRECPQPGD